MNMISRVSLALVVCGLAADSYAQDNNRFVEVSTVLETVPLDDSEHGFGSGMCAADFTGDGLVDLIVLGDRTSGFENRLFKNSGEMVFTEQISNLGAPMGAKACRAADIDNDGDLDVLVTNWWNPAQLFINNGTGLFSEQAIARGIDTSSSGYSASFADFDRDGWVDLYIGNRFELDGFTPAPNVLYRNTGNGYFQDVTVAAGVDDYHGASLTCEFCDYNEDLWPDLFVTNEKVGVAGTDGAELYHNNGDGTFTRVAASLNLDDRIAPMGFDFTDAFNDGGMDFYMSDLPSDHLFRVWDEGQQTYVDGTHTYRVHGGGIGWAVAFFDMNNDGWQDLHVVHSILPTFLYRNPGRPASEGARWLRETRWSHNPGRKTQAITADFDNDGKIDLLHRVHFGGGFSGTRGIVLHKNTFPDRNWLKIRTVGTISNRDGIGTRVELMANGETQRQWVRVGRGFLSSHDRRLHFGLGDATTADLLVHWPSGQCQRLYNVEANQILELVEPKLELIGVPSPGAACLIDMRSPCDDASHYAIMLAARTEPHTILPDGRPLPIAIDALTAISLTPGNSILHGNVAQLHRGWGQALLTLPPSPAIAGMRIYASAVTFDPNGIRAVLPALRIDL